MNFTILGNNVASLPKKRESLNAVIEFCKWPSCITLQETHLGENVKFDIDKYEVYQKNRNSSGGGLLTAVDPLLQPEKVPLESESNAEILVVQIEVNKKRIRIIFF